MKISVFGKSVKGKDHQINEDALLTDKKKNLFVVADGVTIPHGGKEAAVRSCKYLQKFFKGDLRECFQKINDRILKDAMKNVVGCTTLTAVHLDGNLLKVANVGDSPCYIANGEKIFRMTGNDRIFGTASLSQAIGQENISVHYSEEKVGVGSYIVIASDGVTDMMSKDEMFALIKKHKIPRNIVSVVLKKIEERPTIYNDDKTIIILQLKEN